MSAGLSIMKFTPIGGGQEFCEWLADKFNARPANDDDSVERIWIPSSRAFERSLKAKFAVIKDAEKCALFDEENEDEIKEIRAALKGAGGVELSISW